MSVSNPGKTVSADRISCGGKTTVTLKFCAAPGILCQPADIVLALDRSCSMAGRRLERMQAGAKGFIDLIAQASGGRQGCFGGGTRVGLVSYASTAAVDLPLSDTVSALTAAIDGYTALGSTNHADAFEKAGGLFDAQSANRRILLLFTDGETNVGRDPDVAAQVVKDQGVEIFCVGLAADPAPLCRWASEAQEDHVAWTDDPEALEGLFSAMAAKIALAGAVDAAIRETVGPEFQIVRLGAPSHGTAQLLDRRSLHWAIGTVGLTGSDLVTLSFDVRHVGSKGGRLEVNRSLHYSDKSGGSLRFPSPEVEVDCGGVCPEPCPVDMEYTMGSCQDSADVELGDTCLQSLGRVIRLSLTLRNICPGKRVALAVILTEVGPDGREYDRGIKALTVPAHRGQGCRDVQVKCISFAVPEDLNPCGCSCSCCGGSLCGSRTFRTRVVANYVDTDFVCCEPGVAVL